MNVWRSHRGLDRRGALRAGVSILALLSPGAASPALGASAASLLSPAALGFGASQRSASAAAIPNAMANPNFAAQAALSAANLAKAAQAFKDTTAAQLTASARSQLTLNTAPLSGSSWNGAALSGLNPIDDTDSTLWVNANPLQKDAGSKTATVKQTAANALLNWQSFDLDKGETIVFDQQHHSDWTVLNRVVAGTRGPDGSRFIASPSMILGSLKASGSVYVINPNGIIFGPNSQVDVHSLIASSLDVGNPIMSVAERDSFFLNTGILGTGNSVLTASFSYNLHDTVVEGEVKIDAGARITTTLAPPSVSPDAGGFVYLFAPKVENDGTIETPAGETLMVAAQTVQLIANAYPDGGIPVSKLQTFRAVGINTTFVSPTITPPDVWRLDGSGEITEPGSVINRGIINAQRGVVILNGDVVTNSPVTGDVGGVIRADTSITRDAEIFLDARLTLTQAGSIQILPDENGETIPASAIANFHPGSVEMRGAIVDFAPNALIVAPGASVAASSRGLDFLGIYPDAVRLQIATANPRIYMAPDAVIDVSGLDGVTLPMSANLLSFKPFGNEFADQPLQRLGALRGQELTVDIRETGTFNGSDWIGTPLADVSGFANTIQRGVDQLLTTGGTIALSAPVGINGQIVLRQDSVINVGGGYVQYEGGIVNTTKLLTSDGRIVDISRASPLDSYVGIPGITTEGHPHWGASTTQNFVNPLFVGGEFEPGYIEGHDAGGITLDAGAYVLDGSFYGAAIAGERQSLAGQRPDGATANSVQANGSAMPSAGFFTLSGRNNLIVAQTLAPLAANFSVDAALPADRVANTELSAAGLSQADFGRISANFAGRLEVASDAMLSVALGGTIRLLGGGVDVEGQLIARSGTISVEASTHIAGDTPTVSLTAYQATSPDRPHLFDLTIGPKAVLDTSGLWVNDANASPEDAIGPAYIDGGTVTLKTDSRSALCAAAACTNFPGRGANTPAVVDLTGDIVLSQGSLIDVSSGGRIGINGLMQLDSQGRVAGTGGSVTLATYNGDFKPDDVPTLLPPTLQPQAASIVLAGSDGTAEGTGAAFASAIHAYGFAQGGTLLLRAPAIQIGGTGSPIPGALNLPADFFDGNAFGAYSLDAAVGSITVAAPQPIALRQKNFVAGDGLALLPTGARVAEATGTDFLPDILRSPVNLSLSAELPLLPLQPYDSTTPTPLAAVVLALGEGTVIAGDPRASFTAQVAGRINWPGSTPLQPGFGPPIAQQIGVAEILGTIVAPGGTIVLNGQVNSEIWLGGESRLDVSGVLVTDSREPRFRLGSVLPGGTVDITATAPNAAVVGLNGAVIAASGAAGEVDLLQDRQLGPTHVATPIWSDAGRIAITTGTLLYDGSFVANPGAASGRGGSLAIGVPDFIIQAEAITVQQAGNIVPDGLGPTDMLGPLSGVVRVQGDRIAGSGLSDLTLSASPFQGDTVGSAQGRFAPGTITFTGNVELTGLNSLSLDASAIMLTNLEDPVDPKGCNVCLGAHHVALRGAGRGTLPTAGDGVLRVEGDAIDIAAGTQSPSGAGGVLSLWGVAEADFVSTGDIRLRVPLANVALDLTPGTLPSGVLLTSGDLHLDAAQIYPISAIDFTLKSVALDGTIAFGLTGTPASAPLSAGGQVTISAAHNEQDGRLLAPLGVIRLGAQTTSELSPNDVTLNSIVPTQSIDLAAGSVTSVSLEGMNVPFGVTANGSSWSYDSSTGQPLTASPAKELIVSGAAIDVATGASVNMRGGGDIQAMEFVPGIGGSRDVLTGSNVYAIIPGYDPAAAPLDLEFIFQHGDAVPEAGRSVYLSGAAGLPAGYYTLLPPHDATLPGAYRISLAANTQDALASRNTTLPDRTEQIAGYFAEPAAGTRDARTQLFDVQSSAVWRLYSEIDQTSGNRFFGAGSAGSAATPPLPLDAGHAVFSAVSALHLDGLIEAAAATGGRGGEIDIAAQDLEVVSATAQSRSGMIPLDPTRLSHLGADSLLLGGVRRGDGTNETISVIANAVEIHNDASTPLEAPEVILVANVGSGHSDPNANLHVRLDAGSVVRATGTLADAPSKTVTIGDDATKIPGNGALLGVSNGPPLNVVRQDVRQTNGDITLSGADPVSGTPGALISGASLTLDTSGIIRLNRGVTVKGNDISVAARNINFGQITGHPGGFTVLPDILPQLAHSETLTLRSTSRAINFFGDVTLTLGQPGSHLVLDAEALSARGGGGVKIKAGAVDLINSGDPATSVATGSADLEINAATITLGAGDNALSGFGAVTFTGTTEVALRDTGSLNAAGANVTFKAPLLLVGAGADQLLTTTGAIAFTGLGTATPSTLPEIGGTVSIKAPSIDVGAGALIEATAGAVTLEASSGDIHLGAGAEILANGYAQTFFDETRAAPGGSVRLITDSGNILVNATAAIDVSSASGFAGHAGSIVLNAPNSNILTNSGAFNFATLAGTAGDSGGQLSINARTIGTPFLAVPSIFSDTVDVHVAKGDLQLAAHLTAANVTLTADTGSIAVGETIDASGAKGGIISLYGGQRVTLSAGGQLLAKASDPNEKGGDIVIGTELAAANGSGAEGIIDLKGGVIDVSNTANAANGGSLHLRAPLNTGGHDVAIAPIGSTISGAISVTVEAFKRFDTHNSAFNGVIDPLVQPDFYGQCSAASGSVVCSGTLVDFVRNFALSPAAQQKFAPVSSDVLHLQPGIELVNDDPAVNNGDISVESTWNLGAGFAGYLVSAASFTPKNKPTIPANTVVTDQYGNLLPQDQLYKGDLLFEPGISQITALDYRVGGQVTGEPGTVTLRATRDVLVGRGNEAVAITDGFFQTRNTFDGLYQKNLSNWLNAAYGFSATTNVSNVGGYLIAGATAQDPAGLDNLGPPPAAPYDGAANGISPTFSAKDKIPLEGADLFPLIADPNGPIQGETGNFRSVPSWSYRIAAGANTASANPLAVQPLSTFADGKGTPLAGHGNIVLDGDKEYNVIDLSSSSLVSYRTPTMLRTGAGSIDIAAARDFILADTRAPGVVYTAGRNSAPLADPGFTVETVEDPLNPGATLDIAVASEPQGFLNPVVLNCSSINLCNPYGPMTQAGYPVDGGHLTLTAQQDILGFEHPTIRSQGSIAMPDQQYFAPWLLSQGTALQVADFGPFAPLSAYLATGSIFTPSQTSWWINYGSFDQGLLSAGGDVRVLAGRDIQELSVSLPTTARVSGGLSNTIPGPNGAEIANLPVLHLYEGGDLTVVAGRDLKSGAYYEGSGTASIFVGSSISASWSQRENPSDPTSLAHPVSTILAVDTGTIAVTARSNADIGGVVSAASLQNVVDTNGAVFNFLSQSVSTYGPNSGVSLQSVSGNVLANSLAFSLALVYNGNQVINGPDITAYPGVNRYPANFEAVSLNGDVHILDSLRLAPSDTGNLDLLARDSLFTSNMVGSIGGTQPISTGPSLVEMAFDPVNPLAGFGPAPGSASFDLGAHLLHQNDPVPDHFYAAAGDIVAGPGLSMNAPSGERPLAWEVGKPAVVRAAGDIVDLSFLGQNLNPTDVTSILAGRDIFYTGAWQALFAQPDRIPTTSAPENEGGLSLAGPGFFDIEAGRNLGPFVTAAADISAGSIGSAIDSNGTGIVTFGNTIVVGNRRLFSDQDPNAPDSFGRGSNNQLPRRGAGIIALFGVGNGIDYEAVVAKYIDPATATSVRDYLPALTSYLQTLGFAPQSNSDAWTLFQALSPALQHSFVDKVFFAELKLPGDGTGCCFRDYAIGYSAIATLFPASLGYTDNLSLGANGKPNQVETGNLDLLHATIKTLQSATVTGADGNPVQTIVGGDIMLFGPGGSINVGTTAVEVNKKLTNSALGILTLDNGVIDTFTNTDVLVNQSRILTVQGGDILMWSSNGNLDAGRGAKTTVDFKPLSVIFAPNDLQTINLNGLVSGAGIGTIQSTPDAPAASAFLVAPRGAVNAGDAGLRSSGDLSIAALLVLNASNIASLGTVSGVPQAAAVNLGALESSSAVSGQAAQAAEAAVAAAANRGQQPAPTVAPSNINVEVYIGCDPDAPGMVCQRQ